MNEEIKKIIYTELSSSDIVWPKYGSDTIDSLSDRLVDRVASHFGDDDEV